MTHTLLILLLLVFHVQEPAQSKSAKEFLDSALVRVQEKDLDGAIVALTRAIELNPNYVEALFIRGQCLFLKGDRDRALLDYDKVIELAPNTRGIERVYNNRSVIRISKGDTEGAVKDAEKALEVNPNFADSLSNRGLARFMRGDSAGAASDYDKAIELEPKSPATYINRGILRFDRKIFEGAMADFNKAIELAPNTAKPYVDRAVLQVLAGEIDLAVADLKKAVTLDATSISDKDPGIMSSPFKRLQSFISSNPKNARAYEAGGLLRLAQGRRSEATQDFTKCLELDPKLQSEIDRLTKISWNGGNA